MALSVGHSVVVPQIDPHPALAWLVDLVAPPSEPIPVEGDWGSFATVNGFEPPGEWVALLVRYGCGSIGGEAIQLRDPFPAAGSFVQCNEHERRELRGLITTYDWYPRWPVWPDQGGFLPWADIRDGSGEIGWLTVGAPDEWRVAVLERSGKGSATSFTTLEYLLHLARHIDDDEFEHQGLGWMDDRTTIPYRPQSGKPLAHEPLEVTFAAIPYEAAPPWSASSSDLRARAQVQRSAFDPVREAWDQRWSLAEPSIASAAADGIRISFHGFRGTERGWVHPFMSLAYPFGAEARAKQALAEVASALGTTVFDVRNLEAKRVWTDVTGGSAS